MAQPGEGITAPINSRAANYAVVDRIRDLAKWLVLVFGAIGGALLTGVQLSDLGSVEGTNRELALIGAGLGILGATLALSFTVWVLLPIELSLEAVNKKRRNWLIRKRAEEETERLHGHTNIAVLIETKKSAKTAETTAVAECEANEKSAKRDEKLERAEKARRRADDDAADFLSWVLSEKVRWRMKLATAAMFIGAIVVAVGIFMFTWETNGGGAMAKGEAVPKRASGVTVRLTAEGREDLSERLGKHCGTGRLSAVALGGPADALEMVSVPTLRCVAARFTLTPSVGTVTNEKRLRALRACTADLEVPCVVYKNTPASVAGDQVARP